MNCQNHVINHSTRGISSFADAFKNGISIVNGMITIKGSEKKLTDFIKGFFESSIYKKDLENEKAAGKNEIKEAVLSGGRCSITFGAAMMKAAKVVMATA